MWELLVVVAVLVFGVSIYNGLVKLREQGDNAWADIDVQLKRRYDLIPNLVETVKGYATHERDTLDAVIQARSRAMGATTPGEVQAAEASLGSALKSLFALAESYPDLKASGGFRDLQRSLAEIEEALGSSRRYYNAVIRDYNTRIHQIPSNIIARSFGFREREFFEVQEGERAVPRVDFGGAAG
ncbi:MAG TPA: LemA family protein [Longimicrobiales bacterium]|nr:LemA family protein [Longimicrobiales bacterium]